MSPDERLARLKELQAKANQLLIEGEAAEVDPKDWCPAGEAGHRRFTRSMCWSAGAEPATISACCLAGSVAMSAAANNETAPVSTARCRSGIASRCTAAAVCTLRRLTLSIRPASAWETAWIWAVADGRPLLKVGDLCRNHRPLALIQMPAPEVERNYIPKRIGAEVVPE
jgi:hypothetical protein